MKTECDSNSLEDLYQFVMMMEREIVKLFGRGLYVFGAKKAISTTCDALVTAWKSFPERRTSPSVAHQTEENMDCKVSTYEPHITYIAIDKASRFAQFFAYL